MNVKLTTVIIFCADVQKLTSFYTDNFGCSPEGEATPDWAVLSAGAVSLAFHKIGAQYLEVSPGAFKIEDSNVKLVFEVEKDLVELRNNLLQKQVEVGELKSFAGYPFDICDGIDPEGNVFQLVQKKIKH